MRSVYVHTHSIVSPLGFSTSECYDQCLAGTSGITMQASPSPPFDALPLSIIKNELLDLYFSSLSITGYYTKAEKLLLLAIQNCFSETDVNTQDSKLLLILSTTKGNIELLSHPTTQKISDERVHLWSLADTCERTFKMAHKPIVISNACISGINALIVAQRYIQSGMYDHVLVAGVDCITDFVVSGFQSFKAISAKPCRPFDRDREGINLGEAGSAILLSCHKPSHDTTITLTGGAISNDANHISGPSRTGDGLYIAISKAMANANVTIQSVDHVNAHGTATIYNDEMESKAFKLAGVSGISTSAFKGYFGHTLGAAGIVETAICIQSMLKQRIPATLGYETIGTPEPVAVSPQVVHKDIKTLLKTASGFGGGNAAIILQKN